MDDARLQRIEERLAWLERHVLAQDKAMMEMADAAQLLRRRLQEMQDRQHNQSDPSPGQPQEERPPHY